ncbi:sortase [Nonomuraea sp. NPDC046570]|uniref:sortase domain-containing protein n=1 Tax=Nonomuraea sp. NPDC046570 TaxID=3155255 RepID=UPI0033FFD0CE
MRRLGEGARILVDRADGSTIAFRVSKIARYPKRQLPDRQVYGPTPDAELRLITCGGTFDTRRRSYRDNIVVFAR